MRHRTFVGFSSSNRRGDGPMISIEHRISQLEQQRRNLNEKLMSTRDPAEANAVERELWAIRTAIAYYKSGLRRSRENQTAHRPNDDAVVGRASATKLL